MAAKLSRRAIADVVAAKLLDGSTDQSALMRQLAALLVDNGMADAADEVMNDVAEALYAHGGQLTVEVASARALTADARDNIRQYMTGQTGARTVLLRETIDSDLLGGLVARTATAELDASVRTRLRQLTAIT